MPMYITWATQVILRNGVHTCSGFPIVATLYEDRSVTLDNVPAKYNIQNYLDALKMAIRLSLIGQ